MNTINGPKETPRKFYKSTAERERIIAAALLLVTEEPGKSFQPISNMTATDRKAYWAALPLKHKRIRESDGKKQFSRAARRAWAAAFAESSERNPDALRTKTA